MEFEMERRRQQRESVRGKDTPFRVKFTTQVGHAYEYYETYEDAKNADDYICFPNNPWGFIRGYRPKYRVIEKRGPRGGWSKYKPDNSRLPTPATTQEEK